MGFEDFATIETLWENDYTRFGYAKGFPGKSDAYVQVIYPPEMAGLPAVEGFDFLESFNAQMARIAKLKSRGLPRVLEFGIEEGCAFIIYEIFSGWTLEELYTEGNSLPAEWLGNLGSQLVSLVDVLHSQRPPIFLGVLRPDLVLVSDQYELRLLSYGYMRFYPPEIRRDMIAEDSSYSASERVETGEDTIHSDLFALGGVLYFLYTGHIPQKVSGAYISPGSLNAEMTAAQSGAIMKCMEPIAANRFATVRNLKDTLLGKTTVTREEIAPELLVDTERIEAPLTMQGELFETSFVVRNVGKGTLTGTIEAEKEWVKVNPGSFSEDEETIRVWLDSSKLRAGTHKAELKIYSRAGDRSIFVNFPVKERKKYPTLVKILKIILFLIPLGLIIAGLIYVFLTTPTTKLVK